MTYLTSRLSLFTLALLFVINLQAHTLPWGFAEVQIAGGLDPVTMAFSPDGRLFLAEKGGRISIVENGSLLPDAFVEIPVDNFNERGLSGIAIDPDFETNQFVYVYYTVPEKGHNRVSRFTANGNSAIPGSELVLLDLDPLFGAHHNAGALVFGEDKKLYIAVGDGTSGTTPQSLESLLGKILRINSDGSIPTDNPFYDQTHGDYRAIWATGVRNPFAMYVQPGSGRIFITDVGSTDYEEINEIIKGKNYGWPIIEGYSNGQVLPANYQEPIYAYDHTDGCAAVGISIYNPAIQHFPTDYNDKLFFTDYCDGSIRTFDMTTGEVVVFAENINRPLNILTAPDGTMYFIARAGLSGGDPTANTSSNNGSLWRIFYTGNDAPFVAVQPQDQLIAEGEKATFQTLASGSNLVYQWQKNESDIAGATMPSYTFPNALLTDSGLVFRCIIVNADGADTTRNAVLKVVEGSRPTVEITSPNEGHYYRAGDTLLLRGIANDPEDGLLNTNTFRWKVELHHNTHTHPAFGPVFGVDSDTFFIPKIGEVSDNVWYRINFTATDQSGLSKTAERLIYPIKTEFTLKTEPPGLDIDTDGHNSATPYTVKSVVGIIHEVSAPFTVLIGDTLFAFDRWENGQTDNPLFFEAPDDTVDLKAIYQPIRTTANGTGLTGFYFNDENKNRLFDEDAVLRRIDPSVNFEWGPGSPDPSVNNDDFMVRWEGYILPFIDDTINFHVATDDGSRLWVDDQLLIDVWFDQGKLEYTGSIFLKEGVYYPIKLEYYENLGGAVCQLLWSGNKLGRGFVPKSQLFPVSDTIDLDGIQISSFPNPVIDDVNFKITSENNGQLSFELYTRSGQLLRSRERLITEGDSYIKMDLHNLIPGLYYVKISGTHFTRWMEVFKY